MDTRHYPQGSGTQKSLYIDNTLVVFNEIRSLRKRFTLAEVNATGGLFLLPALRGVRWRLTDWVMIALGGNAGGATSLNISGVSGGSAVHLGVTAIAALTRSTIVRAGAANAVVLADGASFLPMDANTKIVVQAIAAGSMTTATGFDVFIDYEAVPQT